MSKKHEQQLKLVLGIFKESPIQKLCVLCGTPAQPCLYRIAQKIQAIRFGFTTNCIQHLEQTPDKEMKFENNIFFTFFVEF